MIFKPLSRAARRTHVRGAGARDNAIRPLYKPGLPLSELYWQVNFAKMGHISPISPWPPACILRLWTMGSAGWALLFSWLIGNQEEMKC
jgi:hypothetical protein